MRLPPRLVRDQEALEQRQWHDRVEAVPNRWWKRRRDIAQRCLRYGEDDVPGPLLHHGRALTNRQFDVSIAGVLNRQGFRIADDIHVVAAGRLDLRLERVNQPADTAGDRLDLVAVVGGLSQPEDAPFDRAWVVLDEVVERAAVFDARQCARADDLRQRVPQPQITQ
jgi:hypothetical protein